MKKKCNKFNLSIASASILSALFISNAFAADGKITFNGAIVAASCDIASSSEAMAVTLPTVPDSSLGDTQGETAGHTSFTISLENCESQTGTPENIRIAFSGTADDNNMFVLKNTDVGATGAAAVGVGLQLYQADGVTKIDINNGSNKDKEFPIPAQGETPKSYDLNYVVAYINTADAAVSPGAVTAIANYSVEYN